MPLRPSSMFATLKNSFGSFFSPSPGLKTRRPAVDEVEAPTRQAGLHNNPYEPSSHRNLAGAYATAGGPTRGRSDLQHSQHSQQQTRFHPYGSGGGGGDGRGAAQQQSQQPQGFQTPAPLRGFGGSEASDPLVGGLGTFHRVIIVRVKHSSVDGSRCGPCM